MTRLGSRSEGTGRRGGGSPALFPDQDQKEMWETYPEASPVRAPVATAADIAEDPQLKARDYSSSVDHAGLGRKFTLPGAFAKLSETPVGPQGAAPQLGEHDRRDLRRGAGTERHGNRPDCARRAYI